MFARVLDATMIDCTIVNLANAKQPDHQQRIFHFFFKKIDFLSEFGSDRMSKADQPTSETQQQLCGSCGSDESLKKCMGCGAVAYCGTTCQKAHWVLHRPECTRIKKEKKERENPNANA